MQSSEEFARLSSRAENRPSSKAYEIFILLSRAAKLEMTQLFAVQIQNAFPGRTEDEELLIGRFSPESADLYEAYVSWLRQKRAIGVVSAFLLCPVSQNQQGESQERGEEHLQARRIALAGEVLASIATGWIATEDFSNDQILVVQDALQEYMERRRGSGRHATSDESLASRVRQAIENIILYIDDPDEQCDLSPLSTAMDLLENVLQDIEHPPVVNATYVSVWDGGTEIRSECKWDSSKQIAFDITAVHVGGVEVLTREYVELSDGITIAVDSRRETGEGIPAISRTTDRKGQFSGQNV